MQKYTPPSSTTHSQSRPFGQGWRSTSVDRQQHKERAAETQRAERQRIDIGDREARHGRHRAAERRGQYRGQHADAFAHARELCAPENVKQLRRR